MNWIVYNTDTGTLVSKHETEPTTYSTDNSIAQVDFMFMPMQPLYLLRYDGNNVIANTEENIESFKPIQSIDLDTLPMVKDLDTIIEPSLNQVIYVEELNSTFKYDGTNWNQTGVNNILNYGLGLGFLYINNLKVG